MAPAGSIASPSRRFPLPDLVATGVPSLAEVRMPRHPFLPLLASSIVIMAAVALAAPPETRRPPALDRARIIDLSHTFDQRTLYWPTAPSGFQLTSLHRGPTAAGFFYSANSFCAPEHGGTHMDAPLHFAQGRQAVDQV